MKTLLMCSLLSLTISSTVFTQNSGPQYFSAAVMNGNAVMTVFGNWGVIGQPIEAGPRGAWQHSTNGYIGDESFLVGLQFPIKDYNNDGRPDTVHSVITCSVNRPMKTRDIDPATGQSWTFMPADSFLNPGSRSVAISNDERSWPLSWNHQWKHLFAGTPLPALEAVYQVNDFNDHHFDDPAKNLYHANFTERNGQGIVVDVRYLQYDTPDLRDMLLRVYDIRNVSGITYDKVVFGYLCGTYVGVTGNSVGHEYADDYSLIYKAQNVVVTGDFPNDNSSNPLWVGGVGKFGSAFLNAPNKNRIASYQYFVPPNAIALGADEELWRGLTPGRYMTPASIEHDTIALAGEDGDYTMGTDYFSLAPGETKRIISALAFGNTKEAIFKSILIGRILAQADFDFDKVRSAVSVTSVADAAEGKRIEWTAKQGGGEVDIYFSADNGETFTLIAENAANTGSAAFNVTDLPDAYFGKFMLVLKDEQGNPIGYDYSGRVLIERAGNGAPYFSIQNDAPSSAIDSSQLHLSFLAGDPDGDTLTLTVSFSTGGAFVPFGSYAVRSDPDPQSIIVDLLRVPNSPSLRLKFELSDGSLADSEIAGPVLKQVAREALPLSNVEFISHNTTASVQAHVVDRSALTGDRYRISFSDSMGAEGKKFYTVRNMTRGTTLLEHAPLFSGSETQSFDGLALKIDDVATELSSYRWSSNAASRPPMQFYHYAIYVDSVIVPYSHPCDYMVVYSDHVVDTTLDGYGAAAQPVSHKVFNITTHQPVKIVYDALSAENYCFEQVGGRRQFTWIIGPDYNTALRPQPGDTLFITTKKGISFLDTLMIQGTISDIPADGTVLPATYALHQNYPNPFNPSTTIRYQTLAAGMVTIKVFDVLGREVAVPVNEVVGAGLHECRFDASRLSSGVYLYTMSAGSYVSAKKMILLR